MDAYFLSHLSGDEEQVDRRAQNHQFLSHLSGDEAGKSLAAVGTFFLSHLSGDEEFRWFVSCQF